MLVKLKDGSQIELTDDFIKSLSGFDEALTVLRCKQDTIKRRILKDLKEHRQLVLDMLKVNNIDDELQKLVKVDLDRSTHCNGSPFKLIK